MTKTEELNALGVSHGDKVVPELIVTALSSARIRFDDGAVQDFHPDGKTDYLDGAGVWPGTWHVEGDSYCSIWPPSPAVACYDMTWLVESDKIVGLSFRDKGRGDVFAGRYEEK